MPGLLMPTGPVCQCTHAAPATIPPVQPRVLVSGVPVATMAAQIAVTPGACPFQIPVGPGTKPQPCVTIKWMMPATRVLILGQPPMVIPAPGVGQGVCLSVEQIPAGPPTVPAVQPRVFAL